MDLRPRGAGGSNRPEEIAERARRLVTLDRADYQTVESGLKSLRVGRSLLQACSDANWIIEASSEDLMTKQKLFENFESVAPQARIVTSSSTTLLARTSVPAAGDATGLPWPSRSIPQSWSR